MGQRVDDSELLARYATSRDQAAFGELVRRYVDLVHSAAARRVGDRHLAEDVTQAVFMVLAARPGAARVAAGALSGWLLTTARYAAANAVKVRGRRRRHEAAASMQGSAEGGASANPSDVLIWREAAAGLDDAVMKLGAADRRAVLLRFFERRSIAEVAAALGATEAAAKQRLSRAVEKLRQRLNRGGAGLAPAGAAGLATLLAVHAVRAAPAGLVSSTAVVSAGSGGGAATAFSIAKGAMAMMTWTKVKAAAAVLAVASVLGTGVVMSVQRASAQGTAVRGTKMSPGGVGAAVAAVREKAAARVAAAEKLIEAVDAEQDVGNAPLTPSFVELKCGALRRLADARIDAAVDPAERVKAAEDCVQRLRDFCLLLDRRKGQDVSLTQLRQGAYYLADAELLLAKMRAAEEGRG